MKRKTRRLAKWASWGLFLGWGFSSFSGAQGQTWTPYPNGPSGAQTPTYAVVTQTGGMALDEGLEVRVHLGWLADPSTFPLHLKLQSTGAGLKVVGAVPNAVVKQ